MVVIQDFELRKKLFNLFYSEAVRGHSRVHETKHRLLSILYWKGISSDVKKWVKECVIY